jgi:MarR family 2-MHQ and catechol resistance regulon transcriptional repressor
MPTHFTGSRAERRTLDTFIKLTRCTNSVMARLAERNSIGDLTYSQFAVLETLYHLGPLTQGEVSQKILKSVSNITTVIDNLERDGLVRRERDVKDRRVIHVHLTEAGSRKIEEVLPAHVAALVNEFKVLSASEQEQLSKLCKKLGRGRREIGHIHGDHYEIAIKQRDKSKLVVETTNENQTIEVNHEQ